MSLPAGTRFGHYEIISLVGQGGMGAVYTARDTRLDRIVAVKVVQGPAADLRERFAREARAVAALQHPHICTLYDVGSHEGTDYIVMEHLEGRPLTGPLPLAEVISYGAQIAGALDAAHRKGITHRDLKPSNIMVTKSGVKVLDFGIARVSGLETVTLTGQIVGTPVYMAPEQWTGATADARTDIYGLGRVLAEMATGRSDPDQRLEPPALNAIVQGCIAKEPDDRWQSARDVRRMLEALPVVAPDIMAAVRPSRSPWWIAGIAAASIASAFIVWLLTRAPALSPVLHLSLTPPPGSAFVVSRNVEGGIALSPDGNSVAFVANTAGHVQLWVRRLDSFEARALAGTDGAYSPFWSPDSRQIAFYTPDRLKKVPAEGGPVHTITTTDPRSAGGAWMAGDVLLMTDGRGEIHRIPAAGGERVRIAEGYWPYALPDGRRFLFAAGDGIRLASLDQPEESRLIAGVPRGRIAFALGHLIYARQRTLVAHEFDPDRAQVTGEPFTVAQSLLLPFFPAILNQPSFSVAPNGLLVHAAGELVYRLRWRNRSGIVLSDMGEPAPYLAPRIGPEGGSVVYPRLDGGNADVWIVDAPNRSPRRLTFDPASDQFPIWSHDGTTITYTSGSTFESHLYRKPADGTGSAEQLTSTPATLHAMDWSADGKFLAFTQNTLKLGTDLMILPAVGDRTPYVFLRTPVSEAHSQFAPTLPTRWIAYSSDDVNNRREIFVAPFVPGQPASTRWQISSNGGTMPRWKGDGRELYYWALDGRIMAVKVDGSGPAFRASLPVALFQVAPPTLRTNYIEFDVTRDGQRFLILEPAEQTTFQSLSVVTNWLPK